MARKKNSVQVGGYTQKGREKTHVKAHNRKTRRAHIVVKGYTRARRRTNAEIDQWGTRKHPKIKP